MKKISALLLTFALVLTAAGCNKENGENNPEETTTTKVTQVIAGDENYVDTSNETYAYLKDKAPLYAKFLEMRRSIPLTFEIEVETDNGTATAGIYIKDESKISTISADGTGASSVTIYNDDKIYYVDDNTKVVYVGDVPITSSKSMVEANLLSIDIMTAMSYKYTSQEKELDGVVYKCEIIEGGENNTTTEYYFDAETEELRYIVANGRKNKITALNNKVNEDAFKIPSDYTESTMEELFGTNQNSTTTE